MGARVERRRGARPVSGTGGKRCGGHQRQAPLRAADRRSCVRIPAGTDAALECDYPESDERSVASGAGRHGRIERQDGPDYRYGRHREPDCTAGDRVWDEGDRRRPAGHSAERDGKQGGASGSSG